MVTLGLISDTHAPIRCRQLPDAVFEALSGVDLILHAGDVGELWVLDQLSALAPVVAVHGNDETAEAQAALPYVQTLSVAGHRIVLTHAHHPDRTAEMEGRKEDAWEPKLTFRADFGRQHNAGIVIFGHTHIPMQLRWEGILLINPGAVASGNNLTRQVVRAVAKLYLAPDTPPRVEHFDLRDPGHPFIPEFEYERGFRHALAPTYESILTPELEVFIPWLLAEVYPLAPEPVFAGINTLAHRCWSGELERITIADVIDQLHHMDNLPVVVFDKLRESPVFCEHL